MRRPKKLKRYFTRFDVQSVTSNQAGDFFQKFVTFLANLNFICYMYDSNQGFQIGSKKQLAVNSKSSNWRRDYNQVYYYIGIQYHCTHAIITDPENELIQLRSFKRRLLQRVNLAATQGYLQQQQYTCMLCSNNEICIWC